MYRTSTDRFMVFLTAMLGCLLFQPILVRADSLWGGDFSGTVYKIDADTGARTSVIEFPFRGDVPRTIGGLAFDPVNNRIVGVSGGSLFGEPIVLFGFDPFVSDPTAEIFGVYEPVTTASRITGIAFDDAGNFHLLENASLDNHLIRYDLESMSVIGDYDLPRPANFNIGDLAMGRAPGELLAIHASSELLFSITSSSGPVQTIGSFSQQGFTDAFAYDVRNDRYFLSDTRLVEFDPASGANLRVVSDDTYFALTFVSVPEPGAGVVSLITAVIATTTRRRVLAV